MKIVKFDDYPIGRLVNTDELRELCANEIQELGLGNRFENNFFKNLGIDSRRLVCYPSREFNFSEINPISGLGANCLNGLSGDSTLVLVHNVFDGLMPNLGLSLEARLGRQFNDTYILLGEGCSGFISGLRLAQELINSNPREVYVFALDCMSFYLFNTQRKEFIKNLGDPRRLLGFFIQRFLFGDGAVGALCVPESDSRPGMCFNHFGTYRNLDPNDVSILSMQGFGSDGNQLGSYGFFAQDVNRLIGEKTRLPDYLNCAKRHLDNLDKDSLGYAIHTGSGLILNVVGQHLGLSEEQILASREVLRTRGNMNCATGAAVLKSLHDSEIRDIFACFFGMGFQLQVAYA